MSYSAFFTTGLALASHPRDYEYAFSKLPPFQIAVHPGTPPRRTRKRRSSLTTVTSPISTIMLPVRTANDVAKSALRSAHPRDGTLLEALHNGTRPRRKTLSNTKDLPSLPAPTSPLPTIPNHRTDLPSNIPTPSIPISPYEDAYPSSPMATDSPRPAYQPGTLRSNPARKSSFLLPMMGRGALLNLKIDLEKGILMEAENGPAAEWYDDEEDSMETDGDV